MKISDYYGSTNAGNNLALIWSGLTGFVALVDYKIEQHLSRGHFDRLTLDNLSFFRANGIIIDNDVDERNLAAECVKRTLKSTRTISRLILVLTRECNCACRYCYQTIRQHESLDLVTLEQAVDYTLQNVRRDATLRIGFFGGEPFLNADGLESAVKRFRQLEAKGVFKRVRFLVTTNGTVLRSKIKRLFSAKKDLERVQITIDGFQRNHDRARPFHGGNGTFSAIMKNLPSFIALSNHVVIRINVHKRNKDEAIPLARLLFQRFGLQKLTVYLAKIKDYGGGIQDIEELSQNEYEELLRRFYYWYFDHKGSIHPDLELRKKYIGCRSAFCRPKWIGPEGKLYQCQHQPDTLEPASGFLPVSKTQISSIPLNVLNTFATWHHTPLTVDTCLKCKYLTFCGGACPLDRKVGKELADDCSLWEMRFNVYAHLIEAKQRKKEVMQHERQ